MFDQLVFADDTIRVLGKIEQEVENLRFANVSVYDPATPESLCPLTVIVKGIRLVTVWRDLTSQPRSQ